MKAILGIKGQMQTFFDSEGKAQAATAVAAGPVVVTEIRTKEKNGYRAVQLGFVKDKKNKLRFLAEIRVDDDTEWQKGQEIKVADVFSGQDKVSISGVSKGKGFAGVVKRWHFKGGPRTHGQSDRERAPGSIGSTTTPGRVYKGKRMAGRMGGEKVTVRNLKVLKVDSERNLLLVSGAVPGAAGELLIVRKKE